MNNVLLAIHIAGALTAIILSFLRVIVVLASRSGHDNLRRPVYYALFLTLLSGIALAVITGSSLASLCVKGLALLAVTAAIDIFITRTARHTATL